MRVPIPPWVKPLERVAPEAKLALSTPGDDPAPRNAVPALESRTENGVPDCTMVMPLTAHPASNVRVSPWEPEKKGRS